MGQSYKGMTWSHPRGLEPLLKSVDIFKADHRAFDLEWNAQSLEGFEAHPIDELAEEFDLLIIDHPGLGEALSNECLVPIASLFEAEELKGWQQAVIGPSFDSYNYQRQQWALPIDAATQVAVANGVLVDPAAPLNTWDEVVELAKSKPVCLSLGGPHAVLTFLSICSQEGAPSFSDDLPDRETCLRAYMTMKKVYAHASKDYLEANPIKLLDTMLTTSDIAYCPLIYGYVNYACLGFMGVDQPLHYMNVPVQDSEMKPSSCIGGTGLAVSKKAVITSELLAYIRFIMSDRYQVSVSPAHQGQPSFRTAWQDTKINAQAGGFYEKTFATMDNGWVRPRFNGYVQFQAEGSRLLRAALADGQDPEGTIDALIALFQKAKITHTSEKIDV